MQSEQNFPFELASISITYNRKSSFFFYEFCFVTPPPSPTRVTISRKRVGMKDYLRQLLVSEPVHGPRVYPGGGNRGSRREDADAGRRGAGGDRLRPRRSTGGWSLRIRRRHQAAGGVRRAPRRRYRRWVPVPLRGGELSRLRFLGADNESQCTLLGMQGLRRRGLAVVPPRLADRGILHVHLLSVTPVFVRLIVVLFAFALRQDYGVEAVLRWR